MSVGSINLQENTMKHFPGYPNIKSGWVHTDRYGDVKLVEITRTSDGFLIGTAKNRRGQLVLNLFIGRAA
jgi:hypothetical protein